MERQPLISVIVPVWNGEKYLAECVASVIHQSLQDMEIILIDDGSTDGTWPLMKRLAGEDERIRILHQENGGVSEARNAGIRMSRGCYIRFVDADDCLPPDSMRQLVEKAQEERCDLVLAAYTEVLGRRRYYRDLGRCEDVVDNDEFLRRLERLSNSFYYGVLWNKLFRGDLIREHQVRFVSGLHWGEDFAFVMRYLAHAERIGYITDSVYDYRRNPKGAVVRQFFHTILHPIAGIKDRWLIYDCYRELYKARGQYEKYRKVLWLYLFRFTIRN
ncbi:MAG: glycosyltransferase [Christensenellaceae bacterium]|nr:glycosyltransferase [Christensenellaceae bacterium]